MTAAMALLAAACDARMDRLLPASPPPLVVEHIVDASGSYPALPAALDATCRMAQQLTPGDAMRGRFIIERSYAERSVFFWLEMPAAMPTGGIASPAQLRRRDSIAALNKDRRERACQKIPSSKKVRRAMASDVSGALAAAAGAFRAAPTNAVKILALSSDLEDNVDVGRVRVDLTGVHVRLVAVESRARKLETLQNNVDRWTRQLLAMGAIDVVLVPLGEVPDLTTIRKGNAATSH